MLLTAMLSLDPSNIEDAVTKWNIEGRKTIQWIQEKDDEGLNGKLAVEIKMEESIWEIPPRKK